MRGSVKSLPRYIPTTGFPLSTKLVAHLKNKLDWFDRFCT